MFTTSENCKTLKGKSGIYRISLLGTNRHYVGQAQCLYARMMAHLSVARATNKKAKNYIHHAIAKYGAAAFEFVVIVFTHPGQLDDLELHFIREFDCLNRGFNIGTTPSSPMLGRKMSDEVKEKIRISNTGKKRSEESLIRIRAANKLRPFPEVARIAQKKSITGKPLSAETKQKLSVKNKGRKMTPSAIENMVRGQQWRKRPVNQFSRDGVLIAGFPSIKDASNSTGLQRANITKVLKGRLRTCGGFIWQYAPSHVN